MYTLFIDTHENTNLAIFKDNLVLKFLKSDELRQSTVIMPLLKKLLEECKIEVKDISEIIIVNGPGSFTGVRLGVTIAKTIAYSINAEIKCINALELKALMDGYKNKCYGIKDAKGIYIGSLKGLSLELSYINNSEINQINIVTDVTYDFNKLIKYKNKLLSSDPHLVNPLYVKKIEAQK